MLSGYCVTVALLVVYGLLCWRDNQKKVMQERQWLIETEGKVEDVHESWKDLTDKENPLFRYTY